MLDLGKSNFLLTSRAENEYMTICDNKMAQVEYLSGMQLLAKLQCNCKLVSKENTILPQVTECLEGGKIHMHQTHNILALDHFVENYNMPDSDSLSNELVPYEQITLRLFQDPENNEILLADASHQYKMDKTIHFNDLNSFFYQQEKVPLLKGRKKAVGVAILLSSISLLSFLIILYICLRHRHALTVFGFAAAAAPQVVQAANGTNYENVIVQRLIHFVIYFIASTIGYILIKVVRNYWKKSPYRRMYPIMERAPSTGIPTDIYMSIIGGNEIEHVYIGTFKFLPGITLSYKSNFIQSVNPVVSCCQVTLRVNFGTPIGVENDVLSVLKLPHFIPVPFPQWRAIRKLLSGGSPSFSLLKVQRNLAFHLPYDE